MRPEDAINLLDFMAMPGARIAPRMTGFARNGDTAGVTLELSHAMDNAPEERLTLRWELRRENDVWRIAGARMEQTPEGPR